MPMTTLDFDRDIEIDAIITNMKAGHKIAALEMIAEHASKDMPLQPSTLLDQLIILESRQNSGIGDGIALQSITAKNVRSAYTIMAILARPIDFDAADNQPVDIFCLLISPEEEGPLKLRRLSRIARLFKNEELVQKIRETDDAETIRALIHNPQGWMMAA